MRVLLVNPPIYDFTAYDFWLRPYGMLRVAGRLPSNCALTYFDFLVSRPRDIWGRGRFPEERAAKPGIFHDLNRHFRRFGRPRDEFRTWLRGHSLDLVLIQTGMTYWYLGVKEVIEDLRRYTPQAVIVLGGIYATLCQAHAGGLEADVVIEGNELDPLRRIVPLADSGMPYRNSSMGSVAAFKLTDGCPFRCTYCSVPLHHPRFSLRPVDECLEEARWLAASGVQHLAFYDDALLFQPEDTLIPFLQDIVRRGPQLAFHTPNALNVRLLTQEIADLMVRAGCCTFFLGFESRSPDWLSKTGGKSSAKEFASAVARLRRAQAQFIIAYIIIGHPDADEQEVEAAMHYAHQQGARILLSEFAPVPGTIDGDRCGKWADMTEPLAHNKTAFTLRRLGAERVRHLKALCRDLNSSLTHRPPSFRDSTSE